jgi:alkylation response protein AidB-like acyl-CoA dehydrogenase
MSFRAPLVEQLFVLETIANIEGIASLPAFTAATPELIEAVLDESAKLAEQVFAPLNKIGDIVGSVWRNGEVSLPDGYASAFRQYVAGGWGSLGSDPRWGGQGLPFVLALAVQEQLTAANMAFALNMMLTLGAIEALQSHASDDLNALYLTKLVSGEWTGTMNLTEPQAGSDVGALRTRAEPAADGTWRIKGSKIFITWGEHDLAENIVHLVLARTPGSPAGTKGISLFLVPKFLEDGVRNDLRCVSIEHKLGIHASPTCTMSFGDADGCVGYMIGAENGGMRAMFTMMNHARINVGLQGVGIAERAYQAALDYARERVQGLRIIDYPDVRRMILTMRATTEAIRALAYFNAAAVDRGHSGDAQAQMLADLLTPVTKAYATDMGVEVASLGIQVFGGMGFIEETGAAQHFRDARIAPIYEGTNGIQAMDLVGRKLRQGRWEALFAEIATEIDLAGATPETAALQAPLEAALSALTHATKWTLDQSDAQDVTAGASPYLRMFGILMGGYLLARQARIACERIAGGTADDLPFLRTKIATASFFVTQILPQAGALLSAATAGAAPLYAISEDQFAA